MSLLNRLASENWSQILQELDIVDILSLWLTGSSLIRQRLGSNGGCRSFCLENESYRPFLQVWPRWLLPQLKGLTTLHLSPPFAECLLPHLKPSPEDIEALPRMLTDLELGYRDAIFDIHLEHLPPGLTRLWLPYNMSISPQGLTLLPSTLFTLGLHRNRLIQRPEQLPRQLVHYCGNALIMTPENCKGAFFSSTLTTLELESPSQVTLWTPVSISSIAHVTQLRSLSLRLGKDHRPEQSDCAFPPNLTSLDLTCASENFPASALPSLPLGLKTLIISVLLARGLDWTEDDFAHLPRGLTKLDIREPFRTHPRFPILSDRSCDNLPSTLTELRWPFLTPSATPFLFERQMRKLPPSLTCLVIRKTAIRYLDHIPLRFTTFSGVFDPYASGRAPIRPLHRFSQVNIGISACAESFDLRGMDAFDYAVATGLINDATDLFVDSCNPYMLQKLPQTLTRLNIFMDIKISDKDILELPDTLTELIISGQASDLTDACLPALPHGLTHLKVNSLNIIGEMHPFPRKIQTLDLTARPYGRSGAPLKFDSLPTTFPPKWPPFLTRLVASSPKFDLKAIKALPSCLLDLTTHRLVNLNGSIFPWLPKCLTRLACDNLDMRDEDVRHLPRGLLDFESTARNAVSDRSASDWPPRLSKLKIPGNLFTFEGVLQLPRTLEMLSLPGATMIIPPPGTRIRDHLGPHLKIFVPET